MPRDAILRNDDIKIYFMENLDQYILANTKPEEELMRRLERETYLRVINPRDRKSVV